LPSILDPNIVTSIDFLVAQNVGNKTYANKLEINSLVYKLYALNDEEVNFIDSKLFES
jgi:hypothetical protein